MTDRYDRPGNPAYDRAACVAFAGFAVLIGWAFVEMAIFPDATLTSGPDNVFDVAALAFFGMCALGAAILAGVTYVREQAGRAR